MERPEINKIVKQNQGNEFSKCQWFQPGEHTSKAEKGTA
jgi:hypothetical protein